jgi:hypothetical protein
MSRRIEIERLARQVAEQGFTDDVQAISALMDELSAAAVGGNERSPFSLADLFDEGGTPGAEKPTP